MSNLPQQIPLNQYLMDGVTTAYPYTFLVLQAQDVTHNDMAVYITPPNTPANPEADLLTINTDYTVTNVGNTNGGTVNILVSLVAGSILTITRDMSVSISTNFAAVQTFNGAALDAAFERVVLIMQQLNMLYLRRALSYAIDTFLPDEAQTNLMPTLVNIDGQIWISKSGQIIATVLEEDIDVTTLRAELANALPGTDGAGLIGYYDVNTATSTTVRDFLNSLSNSAIFLPGMMMDFAGVTAPSGWLKADGSAISRTTYASLLGAVTFTQTGTTSNSNMVITGVADTSNMFIGMGLTGANIPLGATITAITVNTNITISVQPTVSATIPITFYPFGAGDSSTTFNVPDTRRRTTIGAGGAVVSNPPMGIGNQVGDTGGEELHTMTLAELVTHNHSLSLSGSIDPNSVTRTTHPTTPLVNTFQTQSTPRDGTPTTSPIAGINANLILSGSIGNTGSDTPFNVMQPSLVVTKIIKT